MWFHETAYVHLVAHDPASENKSVRDGCVQKNGALYRTVSSSGGV